MSRVTPPRALVATLALAVACSLHGRTGAPDGNAASSFAGSAVEAHDAMPYNQAVQKSSHNAYARAEPLFDQLVWHGIRSLELDVHVGKAQKAPVRGDWFVYHEDYPLFRSSNCTMLTDCLGQLEAFHSAVPDHDVVTLWIDLKDAFGPGHEPEDLDRLLEAQLGEGNVVTPKELVTRCAEANSLRDAVTGTAPTCSFPTLAELRGKFIVAVTGGSACDGASHVSAYGGGRPATRTAFLAPDVDDACPTSAYDDKPEVVFLNMSLSERVHAREVRERGLVSRTYGGGLEGGLDSESAFSLARASGSLHLATDMVNTVENAWATTFQGTRRALGFMHPDGLLRLAQNPDAKTRALTATSGDIGGRADSFWFSYDHDPTDAVYRTFASVPSSHTDPLAKACLMARASTAPDAANVAICRAFADGPLSVQVRRAAGEPTTSTDLTDIAGVSLATPAFMRLDVRATGDGSKVVAEGSRDGTTWKTIAEVDLTVPLPLRGLAVASHGGSPVTAIFGSIMREARARDLREPVLALKNAIGLNASGHGAALLLAGTP